MRILISSLIRDASADSVFNQQYWETQLLKNYGLGIEVAPSIENSYWILRQIYEIFRPVPPQLVKSCNVNKLAIRDDMGPNRPYYPNHGYYCDCAITLNVEIFRDPDQPEDFFDHHGYFLTRASQTLLHELGHAFDAVHGDLSLQESWLKLSGWSKEPKPGLKQLRIQEKGAPEVVGEQYFDPKAEFTRFYAKRNSWDDFADCFSFYVAGMRNKVPENKRKYFNGLLKDYY